MLGSIIAGTMRYPITTTPDGARAAYTVFSCSTRIRSSKMRCCRSRRLGVDHVEGVLAGGFAAWRDVGQPIAMPGRIAPRDLAAARKGYVVLDVRDDTELEDEGHIPDARHLYVGCVDNHLGRIAPELPKQAPIAVVCSVGHRAGLATSMLLRHGYQNVKNVLGGMTAWNKLELEPRKAACTASRRQTSKASADKGSSNGAERAGECSSPR